MTTQITEYSKTEAALAELRSKYAAVVFDVTTTAGMKSAREARRELVTYRTSLEAKRKELKAPLLERSRLLDSEAKRITEELLKLEQPIDAVIKAEEERKAAEKAAAEEVERQRVATIQERITGIRNMTIIAVGAGSSQIAQQQADLQALEITLEDYAELAGEAMQAKQQTLDKLAELHAAAVAHEAEQARLAAERAELEKLRAEAAERERIAAQERAEAEAKLRAEREAQEAKLKAEREAVEAEQRRIAQEQAAAQAEIDRQRRELEAQQAEAERKAREEAEAKARAEKELAERKAREAFLAQGPTAGEIVLVIADRYQVDADTAIRWLASHDFTQLQTAA